MEGFELGELANLDDDLAPNAFEEQLFAVRCPRRPAFLFGAAHRRAQQPMTGGVETLDVRLAALVDEDPQRSLRQLLSTLEQECVEGELVADGGAR